MEEIRKYAFPQARAITCMYPMSLRNHLRHFLSLNASVRLPERDQWLRKILERHGGVQDLANEIMDMLTTFFHARDRTRNIPSSCVLLYGSPGTGVPAQLMI